MLLEIIFWAVLAYGAIMVPLAVFEPLLWWDERASKKSSGGKATGPNTT